MPGPTYAVVLAEEEGVTIVRFRARLVTESEYLSQVYEELSEFAETIGGKTILSLEGVEAISSAGLSALFWFSEQLRSLGGELRVCDASPFLRDILKTAHLDEFLQIHETKADALKAFECS